VTALRTQIACQEERKLFAVRTLGGRLRQSQVFSQDLRYAIREAPNLIAAKSQRSPASDALQLSDYLLEPVCRRERRGNTQNQRDQSSDCLSYRCRI
jgi:hypothetical protein